MVRRLRATPGDEMIVALRGALSGDGPAVFAGSPLTPLPETVPVRVALVVESSGSTGSPKRVAIGADALLASAAASETALGGPGQWLLALPTTYIAGINVLVRSLSSDTIPVELAPGHFDVDHFAAAAATMDHPRRFTALVPAQLARLMNAPTALRILRRFDGILVGGQATPAPMVERALELGLNIVRTYGSSETSGGCVYNGVPIGHTEMRVVDGQVELSGAVLGEGYLGDDERTALAFHTERGQRWYRTGDTGRIDDGVLTITGRLDDVIISGGLKVSLAALERMLNEIGGLGDLVVVAAGSAEWGEVPVVVSTRNFTIGDIREAIVDRLGRAAVPARVVVVDELPRLPSGKPDRRAARSVADR
ncbi:MAG: o-succinylbenzoate--CoA ligase [Microbacteriaceae bacterium]|nr:o-succinylbenzoate--CoA ligase [Microbacteriaceae bacterium]